MSILRFCVLLECIICFNIHAATRHWDAGGGSTFWATPGNWSNNILPAPGDALTFPFLSTGNVVLTNNFVTGTDFASLTLEDYNILRGNAVDLTEGVVVQGGPVAEVALDIRQLGECRITAISQSLTLSGSYALNGFPVVMRTEGGIHVSGTIGGMGATSRVIKEGAGMLLLSGTNTYEGGTTVSEGELRVDGIVPGAVTLSNGSTLSGRGVILGSVTTAGNVVVLPGPRIGSPRAVFSIGGTLTLNPSASVGLIFYSPTAGAGHDQLRCSNTVDLASARLLVAWSLLFQAPTGTVMVIVSNTSANPTMGEFAGLPEGSRFLLRGMEVELSYKGGDGNDVTLTRTLDAPPSTLTSIECVTNDFKLLTGMGLSNLTYAVDATTDLGPAILWTPLGPAPANGSGIYQFLDTNAPLFPHRFYRVLSP